MSVSSGGVINDLISRDDLAQMVGEGFSEARWNEVKLLFFILTRK
jgi:hypothetical protein